MANRQQRRALERQQKSSSPRNDVAVAYIHPDGAVGSGFSRSMLDLVGYDRQTNQRLGSHLEMISGANIVTARNLVVKQFLETSAQWLFLIDADMVFAPDTVDRLLASADKDERPIVGGLCFALSHGEGQLIVPTIYSFNGEGRMVRQYGYPENELFPVAGTGAACLLVHRRVFEGIFEKTADERIAAATGMPVGTRMYGPPWPWFAETITGPDWGDSASEDITFSVRAGSCGFPIWVDTRVKIGHQKPMVIDEDMYRRYLPTAEEPAPTYVVIPVKGKQELTHSILDQLDAQRDTFEHCFVYDNADHEPDACGEVSYDWLTVIPAAGLGIHEMWNLGIKEALNREPRCNIAILNNDLELGPDFLAEMAKGLRAHPSIGCVGGNYDGRDQVELVQAVKGICAGRYDGTGGLPGFAFMIRSELVEALGGKVFDERFRLWFGDNDFTIRMDQLGVTYGIARDAHVVHIDGGSKTSGSDPRSLHPDVARIVEKDRQRFVEKYPGALG